MPKMLKIVVIDVKGCPYRENAYMGQEVFNYCKIGAFTKFIKGCSKFASNLLLLKLVVEIHNAQKQKRDANYSECLEEIKKYIKNTSAYFHVFYFVW